MTAAAGLPDEGRGESGEPPESAAVDRETGVSTMRGEVCIREVGTTTGELGYSRLTHNWARHVSANVANAISASESRLTKRPVNSSSIKWNVVTSSNRCIEQ